MQNHTTLSSRRYERIELPAETFKKLGYALVDQIAGHNSSIADRPVVVTESAGALEKMLRSIASPIEEGQDAASLLENATQLLLSRSLFNGHPKFWGYITSSPAPLGILGDLLAAAVNPNVGAWILSPVATEIEKLTIEWIGQFMHYPAGGGLLVSGGNMANNIGFLAALRAKTGAETREKGLRGLRKQLTLYCSRETHTWVQKAADLYGLGTDSIRWVATAPDGSMDLEKLELGIQEDLAAGHDPFLVIGTAGSVSTGVVDPLEGISRLCKKYGLWFHVDGAYGGLAASLPELHSQFDGLEAADSVAVDPHKWLYAPLEAGCVLVKKPKHLTDAFSYHPPYYNFENSDMNYVDFGPQNSRGFRALKVWLSCHHLGMAGYRQLLREDILLARHAADLLGKTAGFQVFTSHLSITPFRYVPEELKDRAGEEEVELYLNGLNQALRNKIEQEGLFFLSNAIIEGKFALRMCIVNFRTTVKDIDAFPAYAMEVGKQLHEQSRKEAKATS